MGTTIYTKTCKECKIEYSCKSKEQIYCSKKCAGIGRSNEKFEKFINGETELERPKIKRHLAIIRKYECEVCNLNTWMDKILPLQLDHIDGNASNNNLTNLRLICGNCHSQTSHYAGKNRGNGRKSIGYKLS